MMGATGAVGGAVLDNLLQEPSLQLVTSLGRNYVESVTDERVEQNKIDIFKSETYAHHMDGHQCAICTLGVGQPSTVSKEQYVRIDKTAVVDFATACKTRGINHFQLLCSVGADSKSRSFYLRIKGELEDELKALNFDRLSLFHPSMILTETNRYGFTQGVILALWPKLNPILQGPLKKFRGVPVAILGGAIARNVFTEGHGVEVLEWGDFRGT